MRHTTPDGRYFVVKGQLWRCSNPALSDDQRQQLVQMLMEARRAVKVAKATNHADQMRTARAEVESGEKGTRGEGPGMVERWQPGLQPPQGC